MTEISVIKLIQTSLCSIKQQRIQLSKQHYVSTRTTTSEVIHLYHVIFQGREKSVTSNMSDTPICK